MVPTGAIRGILGTRPETLVTSLKAKLPAGPGAPTDNCVKCACFVSILILHIPFLHNRPQRTLYHV